ncbi:beta-N-acetylglucosaminidase [hydrothermal vent metagenome]|uniref:Beta-N-acetylglucosaminidase n=1 Tax=hydrothermal vent metagenome TaxID=652676 RepID=A0A3B1CHU8_9ZZZZ
MLTKKTTGPSALPAPVIELAQTSSARDVAGQLLTLGFEGTRYTSRLGSWFKKFRPGGVILFSKNIETSPQTATLICDLKKLSEDVTGVPLIVAVDQEGGRVARLPDDFSSFMSGRYGDSYAGVKDGFPTARALGEEGSLEQAEEVYYLMGKVLSALGFNLDYAPVLDLDTNKENPVIGDRSFGCESNKVSQFGRSAIRGLRKSGMLACCKHFPGHGDTSLDSHEQLPVDERPARRFRSAEFLPFGEAVKEGIEFIMTAHIVYPAFEDKYPATLSRKIITDLLRDEIQFNGVIVSDDMDMKAVTSRFADDEAARLALLAGVDNLLVCHDGPRQWTVFETALRLIDEGALSGGEVKNRLNRLLAAKRKVLSYENQEGAH